MRKGAIWFIVLLLVAMLVLLVAPVIGQLFGILPGMDP
jgi:hypothetical protein